jgi:hypothetical protein
MNIKYIYYKYVPRQEPKFKRNTLHESLSYKAKKCQGAESIHFSLLKDIQNPVRQLQLTESISNSNRLTGIAGVKIAAKATAFLSLSLSYLHSMSNLFQSVWWSFWRGGKFRFSNCYPILEL